MTASQWTNPQFARQWVDQDMLQNLLDLPRAIATAIVAADRPDARLLIDIGSGPGAFLERFLSALPGAQGVGTVAAMVISSE